MGFQPNWKLSPKRDRRKRFLPKLSITFHGGADEVTGSRHFVEADQYSFLLDCGLFQGHRRESIEKNKTFHFSPKNLNAVLLSHAHIDHSGALPLLGKLGFPGPIHCTRPTADLSRIMLMDSAFLQEEDAKFFNKIHSNDQQTIEPLYTKEDAERVLKLFESHEYDTWFALTDTIKARFINAGHVLGSAMIEVEIKTPKGLRRILFTGDLGRRKSILMEPPAIPKNVDVLLLESTYGNRRHDPIEMAESVFSEAIQQACKEKGRILIPSFALERTQEIVFILEKLRREKRIPPIRLYVDSPMAVGITEVFDKHLDSSSLSAHFKDYNEKKGDPFGFLNVRYMRTVEESKSLNELPGEKIILAGSGMCEGGRILHHLRNNIDKDNTQVLLVGYQAEGTLGRRLSEGAKKVKIFGLEHDVRASVKMLQNFSSHADQDDLLWFVKSMDPKPRKLFLVHGDTKQRQGLAALFQSEGINSVETPTYAQDFTL